jgi:transglutaminase-like putative cysteine protease
MTWRISVVHTTTHRYRRQVFSSYNEARVVPLSLPRQVCLDARVDVDPAARVRQYWDYWGTLVNAFDLHLPHTSLTVRGHSLVETSPPAPVRDGGWPAVAGAVEKFPELLAPTTLVPSIKADTLKADIGRTASPNKTARAAADWVRGQLAYEPGVTDVTTSAPEALANGRGVCQDFAHVTLAVLRGLGIPARYVSGYFHPNPDAAIGENVAGQGHAWVEWWCGDWVAWDPTHGIPAGERHVVVGRGRDYADVPPLKGIYQGGPADEHEVTVEITRTA